VFIRPAIYAYTGSTDVVLYGVIGNRVDGAYQGTYDVPFRAAVSMSYPKDMYVKADMYAEPVSGLAYEY
jgi:hypothetical protein